ncbi:uncharacterized protein K460DRAFT_6586 [Cucurbitaria berberidis CBS 394.84]|uniref:Uncharacterized protein n=1 Tax=Cucurbitaria berberidis CBS 394.84 TaxID=1168544 RepID=A0A9P4GRA6_9PLEO|nr:uncharacterized protein K460DRAFT_6586 [Cucurbitaria berberidis CBS 394.84]KAF1849910.1 hypothetical protein K460DRAFT_6586 [Cucurbitaria berberidis CBS 394.84]
MASPSRSLQNTWDTAWATAPPAACQTLHNLNNAVAWGEECVFEQDAGIAISFSVNTACMPWATSNAHPSASTFYSPATACPPSWSAVATHTSGDQWVTGETGLQCCPGGFAGDGRGGCRPGSSGSWPVVECSGADAEKNGLKTYSAAAWPVTARPTITALRLRYQASDMGRRSATSGGPSPTSSSGGNGTGGGGGLSTGAIAAIAVIIPLLVVIIALVVFFIWRRKKHGREAAALLASRSLADEKTGRLQASLESSQQPYHTTTDFNDDSSLGVAGRRGSAVVAVVRVSPQNETPEWNAELDASEAERHRLLSPASTAPVSAAPVSTTSIGNHSAAIELGGMARVPRKPIQPVELDSTAMVAEVGDAYIPYRTNAAPGR